MYKSIDAAKNLLYAESDPSGRYGRVSFFMFFLQRIQTFQHVIEKTKIWVWFFSSEIFLVKEQWKRCTERSMKF